MIEQLTASFESDADLLMSVVVTRQVLALVLGCVIAGIFLATHGRATAAARSGRHARSLMATLVLLTVLISMMTMVIGDNVARAFSLVGSLAIVRFRTVVEDTRDTAFVIFAVSIGMAIGAGFLKVPLVAIPVAATAAFLFRPRLGDSMRRSLDADLLVRVGLGEVVDGLIETTLARHLEHFTLTAMGTARQRSAIEWTYAVRLQSEQSVTALVDDLNRIAGVQSIELTRK